MRTFFIVIENKNLENPNLQKVLLPFIGVTGILVSRK